MTIISSEPFITNPNSTDQQALVVAVADPGETIPVSGTTINGNVVCAPGSVIHWPSAGKVYIADSTQFYEV